MRSLPRRPSNALRDLDRPVLVRPLTSLAELVDQLGPEADRWWGWLATPVRIRLLNRAGGEWRELLAEPRLVEARIFRPERDLRWFDGRGVLIGEVPDGEATVPDPELPEERRLVPGAGWLYRDRRSRLWGEWLEGTDGWYEERIPDRWVYEGIEPGREQPFVFLVYREYLQDGAVRFVRFSGLEGGKE